MPKEILFQLLFAGGIGHLCVLVASALVPFLLNWREELAFLTRLHRQMYWVYGGYVVLSIIAFALIILVNVQVLASGSGLARSFCGYVAVFWSVRLCLQVVFDVKAYMTTWWLRLRYHRLTMLFTSLVVLYGWVAFYT